MMLREYLIQALIVIMGAVNMAFTMTYAIFFRHAMPVTELALAITIIVFCIFLYRDVEKRRKNRELEHARKAAAVEESRTRFTMAKHQSDHERKRHLQVIESMIFLGEIEKAEHYAESILSRTQLS